MHSSDLIAALAADYCNVYVVEPDRDCAEAVKLDGWLPGGDPAGSGRLPYTENLNVYVNERVYGPDRDRFARALSLGALSASLAAGEGKFSLSYRIDVDGGIHRYSVHCTLVSAPGEPPRIVMAFRNIDALIQEREGLRDEGVRRAYHAISQIYLAMFRVNVETGTYETIKSTGPIRSLEVEGSDDFAENVRSIVTGLAVPDDLDGAMRFLDLSTLPERLSDATHISTRFTGRVAGHCKLHFIKEPEGEGERLRHVVFAVELADEEKLVSVFEAFSRGFQNVFWISLDAGTARILKLDGYLTEGLDRNDRQDFSYEAVLARYTGARVHPDERQTFLDAVCLSHLREVFCEQGRDEFVGSYRVLDNGETHNYQYNYIKMEGGEFVVCGFQNIDAIIEESLAQQRREREREEAHKRELEQQVKIFDNLARNFRNVYVANIVDATARILKLGEDYDLEAVTRLKGRVFPFQQIIDQWIAQRVHPDDRERLASTLALPNLRRVFAQTDELVGTYRSLDGGVMHNYQFRLGKLDDEGNIIAGFQIIDAMLEEHIAEDRRQREIEEARQRELVAAKEEADRANRAKTDFLLRMSHDIRTPLNGITGMLDIAERFPDDLERQNECREKIREASVTLLELVNEVLDMSKLESGEIVLDHVPFDLAQVSRDVYGAVREQAEERGIQIVVEGSQTGHPHVVGSPTHFKRLVMNLLSNAIKYNKENGKVFISSAEKSFVDGVSTVEFVCRDTGIGMSPEFQKRLFEPFTQEQASPRSSYAGTGLGMSIAKSIVDKMGGTIEFVSEQGVGTTFTVTIPFEVDATPAPAHASGGDAQPADISGMEILLVEDNDLNLEIAEFLLGEEGASVTVARDGREGLDAFAASGPGHFDCILMDVMMPVMNGYEATRAIRALDRPDAAKVPIVAMTANAFTEDKLRAREAGMNEHASKPLDTERLVKTIARLVAQSRGA